MRRREGGGQKVSSKAEIQASREYSSSNRFFNKKLIFSLQGATCEKEKERNGISFTTFPLI